MLLMKGFYESLPPQLEEAAKIDGASNMYVFRKIIIPLSKPMVATIAFFQVVGYWNSMTATFIFSISFYSPFFLLSCCRCLFCSI